MNKNDIRTCTRLAGGALLLIGTPAAAGTNGGGMQVGAQVVGRCTVSATDLAFGILDTQNVTQVDANATVTIGCSGILTVFRIEMDWGQNAIGEQRRIRNAAGDVLPYQIYRNNNRTQRWGGRPVETRNGVIIAGIGSEDFEAYGRLTGIRPDTPKGVYTDQVTVTVNF